MKGSVIKIMAILCLLALPFSNNAQVGFTAGGFIGASNYLGDLVETGVEMKETQFAYGGFLKYNFVPWLATRINVLRGKLSGDDVNNPSLYNRAFKFEADLSEVSFLVELSMFNRGERRLPNQFRKFFTPYIYGGFGVVVADAIVDYSNSPDVFIKEPFPEEGDRADFYTIPLGVGFRYQGFDRLRIDLEAGFRPVFSDYLDGVSLNGRADRNDWYVLGGVNISYYFSARANCRDF